MEIAFCLDKNYLMPCGVAICSVCENNRDEAIIFHIVSNDLDDENKDSLQKIVSKYHKKIIFYDIKSNLLKDFPVGKSNQPLQITVATYIRIFLSQILPLETEKVLYLDCDIVVTDNLKDLWLTNIDKYPVAATLDYCSDEIKHYNKLKLDPNLGYYNAGVLIINLKYWRENDCFDNIVKYFMLNHNELQYQDQDLINGVFQGKIYSLKERYNVQISYWGKIEYSLCSWKRMDEIIKARNAPAIIHYISTCKPWHSDCFYNAEHFLHYLNLTEWKSIKLKSQFTIKSRIYRKIRHILEKYKIIKQRLESYHQFEDTFLNKDYK